MTSLCRALVLNLPGLILIVSFCCMIGIEMFAFYADCHPITFGLVENTDQVGTSEARTVLQKQKQCVEMSGWEVLRGHVQMGNDINPP